MTITHTSNTIPMVKTTTVTQRITKIPMMTVTTSRRSSMNQNVDTVVIPMETLVSIPAMLTATIGSLIQRDTITLTNIVKPGKTKSPAQ
jgi:hypothetical protein